MVEVPKVGRNIEGVQAGAAAQASEDLKKLKEKEVKKKVTSDKGLGLENIPAAADADIEISKAESLEETEAASTLDKIDQDLKRVQDELRNVIARKIKLADKHDDRKHELLVSAFNDCKQAYIKIHNIRELLS